MSIDKIIERIRMIENNDFSKKENVISENIGLTSNERDTLFNTGSHVVSTIIQDYPNSPSDYSKESGFKITDPNNPIPEEEYSKFINWAKTKNYYKANNKTTDKAIKALSLGYDSINKANSLYDKWMGSVDVNLNDGSSDSNTVLNNTPPENLPRKDESKVFNIYNELKNRNILPKDLDPNNFKPKYGYFRSKTNKNLILLNNKIILLYYSDDKLTTLLGMKINKYKNLSKSDFIDLYNEFDKNKSKYKISKISILNKNSIDIKF
jgi:hypothetical protein